MCLKNSFPDFSYDKERSFVEPSRNKGEFEDIIDFDNIGEKIIWNQLFKSFKRGRLAAILLHWQTTLQSDADSQRESFH